MVTDLAEYDDDGFALVDTPERFVRYLHDSFTEDVRGDTPIWHVELHDGVLTVEVTNIDTGDEDASPPRQRYVLRVEREA